MKSLIPCVKETLNDASKWIKGSYARTAQNGESVGCSDPSATCFCMVGALRNCRVKNKREDAVNEYSAIEEAIKIHSQPLSKYHGVNFHDIPSFNDHPATTFEDVQEVLNIAEKLSNKEE